MQLKAILDLQDLTAEEAAKFELKCKKLRITTEDQTSKMLREFIAEKAIAKRRKKKPAA